MLSAMSFLPGHQHKANLLFVGMLHRIALHESFRVSSRKKRNDMKYALILLLAAMLTACASSNAPRQEKQLDGVSQGVAQIANDEGKVSLDDERLVCTTEKHLGSNIPKRICMTKAERKKAQDAAQTRMQNRHDDFDRVIEADARNAIAGPN